MSSPLLRRLAAGLSLLLLLAACDREKSPAAGDKTIDDRFAIKVGDQVVQLQVAVLSEEMERGLMFRPSMGENEGMVFVFATPQRMSFWMRDTLLPLDIGYFTATGELREIYPMYPHDERSVMSHARDLQFAVEMNQGWYARHGVKPGARLDLAALATALRARGVRPEKLGLP